MRRLLGKLAVVLFSSVLACRSGEPVASDGALITFDKYHTVEEFQDYLESIVDRHSNIAELTVIGRSRGGRPILAVEINNPETGPAGEKPAFYLDGNIHGGEVLGGEAALFFVNHLLTRYGVDEEITRLIDTRAFYVVPLVNPDGRAISVDSPENHRWNIRPGDEDGDGAVDEDPPEDLDLDGRILRMRVIDPDGPWQISDSDPRRMVRRPPGGGGVGGGGGGGGGGESTATYYQVYTEGIDNDEDGRFNEDRVGGVDLNRNFPSNWSAAQFASGPYPLSEPETHALVEYITSRPNIAAIHTYHTSGGLLLRFPTLADQDWEFPRADLEDYRAIADEGIEYTGYANYAYEKQVIVDLMSPGHGVFNDWASNVFGVLAMTTEMWSHAIGQGQEALFRWNDDVLGGRGFIDWYDYDHPQLGQVQLGGWDRWSIASPPDSMIADELERNNRWVLSFAEKLPRVVVLNASARQRADDASHFDVRATIGNVGWMATATVHANDVLQIARPVTVRLNLSNAELVDDRADRSLGVLAGFRGEDPVQRELEWRVRVVDSSQPASVEIVVWSEKAGVARHVVVLDRDAGS